MPELIAKTTGDGIVTGFARIGGHSVALIMGDYMVFAGTKVGITISSSIVFWRLCWPNQPPSSSMPKAEVEDLAIRISTRRADCIRQVLH